MALNAQKELMQLKPARNQISSDFLKVCLRLRNPGDPYPMRLTGINWRSVFASMLGRACEFDSEDSKAHQPSQGSFMLLTFTGRRTCLRSRCIGILLAGLSWLAFTFGVHAQTPPQRVPILVYHRFASSVNDSMTVRVSTFNAQLRFLRERGYQVVPLRQVVSWLTDPSTKLPPRPIVLTVDDGHQSVFNELLPIAQQEHLPITLFIYPSAISNASYALTWDQVRKLKQTGLFDVQSHTYWHPNFNIERRHRSAADFQHFVRSQLDLSRQRIEAEVGGRVDLLAWPFGICDDELMALAAGEGYIAAFSLEPGSVYRHSRMLALPRFLMVDSYGVTGLAHLLGEPSPQPGLSSDSGGDR
ncbi:polysaccharide deacetylase family protein [Paraburkholderia phytofirmans]|uniref:Polysaccharide deacetylase n=2 Tax=Paraburkholderia phytofirmans TaxID=261302 RepID=B2TG81_PARPJ|nr:polysaccharide deacetylase family protein [Paraburkholderia phytofirmans]ACD19955.1 polysaccharide deacetylase [Paraburkholderia phytofirmans PsJN]